MELYKKQQIIKLFFAILLTIFLPLGIISIVLGASKSTALLIVGIICTILGFYGAPMVWMSFANNKQYGLVLRLILTENIYDLEDISSQISRNLDETKNLVLTLIQKGYLKGYILKDNFIELNTNKKQTEVIKTRKCPTCGGTMKSEGYSYVCEYCGLHLDDKKHKV